MSKRTAFWLAWSMCALSLALTALSLLLLYLNCSHPGVPIWEYWAPNTLITVGLSTVGAVITPRLPPKNPIGWLFCATGLLIGVAHFSGEYAIYTLLALVFPLLPTEGIPAFIVYSAVVLGVFGLVAVAGLWTLKRWSVWLTIVMSVLNILSAAPGFASAPTPELLVSAIVFVVGFALIIVLVVLPGSRRAYT